MKLVKINIFGFNVKRRVGAPWALGWLMKMAPREGHGSQCDEPSTILAGCLRRSLRRRLELGTASRQVEFGKMGKS